MRASITESAADTDSPERALEVVILWGQSVLCAEYLSPPRGFWVGEALDERGTSATDFSIGAETLGVDRLPVVLVEEGVASLVVPQGALGELVLGGSSVAFEDLGAQGLLLSCPELAGARQCRLPEGSSARLDFAGFTFFVRPTRAARRIGVGGGPAIELRSQRWTAASVVAHLCLLLAFYFVPPKSAALSSDLLNEDSRLVSYMREAHVVEDEEPPPFMQDDEQKKHDAASGKRHEGDEGAMGKPNHEKTSKRYGVQGPQDNPDPHLARDAAKELAANAGIIGVIKQAVGSWDSPTSPYGRDTALGSDPMSALGALFGNQIGANGGPGGLGMIGTGRRGGGSTEGTIGVGKVGTLGGLGYGGHLSSLGGRRPKVPPPLRSGRVDVRGSLSKEVISRVVHRHLNEMRFCYEQQLQQRPDLQGRISVKFIIAPTGEVKASVLASSTLGNAQVERCVVDAVARFVFPQPEGGGLVVVTYPFVLQQVGD